MSSSLSGYGGMKSPSATGQSLQGSASTGNKIPKGYKQGQLQQFTPEQMELFQQMFGQVSPESYTSQLAGGDEDLFNEMEAPALRQFNELQGNMASRFSGMGGTGARRSSGFQNSMSAAGSNFAQDLQGRRQELQRQAISDLMGMSNNLLSQKPYENFMVKKQHKEPFWKQLLGIISPAGGDIASGDTHNTQNFLSMLSSLGGA